MFLVKHCSVAADIVADVVVVVVAAVVDVLTVAVHWQVVPPVTMLDLSLIHENGPLVDHY